MYAVTLSSRTHSFLDRSVGGHFKQSDPTVSPAALAAKWAEETATLYIGRASDLRSRVDLLARYGRGQPVAHRGGRYLWQLAEHAQLRVCWRHEPDPVRAEAELLDELESAVGQLPFASLVRGTKAQPLAAYRRNRPPPEIRSGGPSSVASRIRPSPFRTAAISTCQT